MTHARSDHLVSSARTRRYVVPSPRIIGQGIVGMPHLGVARTDDLRLDGGIASDNQHQQMISPSVGVGVTPTFPLTHHIQDLLPNPRTSD
jgi:hypothetical protein